MTLPATNIHLSAVNTELGNTSTASINLNTSRVRSLGSVATTGTTFSMSSFANKSGTWISTSDTSLNFSQPDTYAVGLAIPATTQDFVYSVSRPSIFPTPPYQQARIDKFYVNGAVAESFALAGTNLYPRDIAVSFNNTAIYVATNSAGEAFVKMSTTGNTVLGSCNYNIAGGFVVFNYAAISIDASDNCYIAAAKVDPITFDTFYIFFSVDSSLSPRWGVVMPYVIGSNIATATSSKLDSSGNVYVGVTHYQNGAVGEYAGGYIKYSSSGTELSRTFRYASIFTEWAGSIGVNNSGAVAIVGAGTLFYAITVYFDSSGTYQWSRAIVETSGDYQFQSVGATVDDVGNVYSVFSVFDTTNNTAFTLLLKYNSSGVLQWQRKISQNFNPDWGIVPRTGNSPLIISGVNQELITVGLTLRLATGSTYEDQCTLTVRTDGSGVGNYAFTIGAYSFTISYAASTFTDSAFTTTASTRSLSITSATPTINSTNIVSAETPFTVANVQVNI
jgi:hypothetical protein